MSDAKAGKLEYRTDRGANVHVPIGKRSFDERALLENYAALIEEIVRAKPSASKGRYIKQITLTTTMGPGIHVDSSITQGHRRRAGGSYSPGLATSHPPKTVGSRNAFEHRGVGPTEAGSSQRLPRSTEPALRGFRFPGGIDVLKTDKERIVEELAAELGAAETLIVADYRGLTNKQLEALRDHLIPHGARFRIVKNTLTRRAAEQAGADALLVMLEGPTAIAFIESSGDPAAVAKALAQTAKETNVLTLRGGILEGKTLTGDEVDRLATLPPTDVLRAQLVGAIVAPLTQLLALVSAPLRDLHGLVDARIKQLEEQGEVVEPVAEAAVAEPARRSNNRGWPTRRPLPRPSPSPSRCGRGPGSRGTCRRGRAAVGFGSASRRLRRADTEEPETDEEPEKKEEEE